MLPVLLGTWVVLSVGTWIFYWKASADTKRRNHPFIVIGTSVVFLCIVFSQLPYSPFLWFFALFVAFIAYQNIRLIQFCDACNATIYPRGRFKKMERCPKCGAALDRAPGAPDEGPGGPPST